MLTSINILFNPLKHHVGFIREFISHPATTFSCKLKTVGHCQLDLYFGELKIESICQEILEQLRSSGVSDFHQYRRLLYFHHGYHTMIIADGSKWVLRLGKDKQAFVHIHPARNSPFTLRVNANTLKSVLALGILVRSGDLVGLELRSFNTIRTSTLNLSPVKNIEEMKAVERTMKIIFNRSSDKNITYESLVAK